MNILEINRGQLPFWIVEVRSSQTGQWSRFTQEPFPSADAACDHIPKILAEYKHVDAASVRVAEYTYKLWQSDLIDLVLKDPDVARRALTVLRPETLADALKG